MWKPIFNPGGEEVRVVPNLAIERTDVSCEMRSDGIELLIGRWEGVRSGTVDTAHQRRGQRGKRRTLVITRNNQQMCTSSWCSTL